MTLDSVSQPLTFTSLNALRPCVLKLCVTTISTLLEPSTTRRATAEFAGFLGGAALGTSMAIARYTHKGIVKLLKPSAYICCAWQVRSETKIAKMVICGIGVGFC